MKRSLLFLASFLILCTVLLERGGLAWSLERPLLHFLARKTHRSLPEVTAVILPLKEGFLIPQDVALTVRALLSFNPRLILVAAPMGELSAGPLSLIREAQAEGTVKGIPFVFGAWPNQHSHETYQHADVSFLPTPPALTAVAGEVGSPGLFGFILPPTEKKENPLMPLFGTTAEGTIVASLWWQGLAPIEKREEKFSAPVFLLGKQMLFFLNNNVIWLGANASLLEKKVPKAKSISLDDFLLRREEMERGQIRPDLDTLFRNKTVILGGVEAVHEADLLQDAQQASTLHYLNTAFYGALLFILALGMMCVRRFSGIDFLLLLFFSICCYAGAVFLLFYFCGILLPLLLPATMLLLALLKMNSACAGSAEE